MRLGSLGRRSPAVTVAEGGRHFESLNYYRKMLRDRGQLLYFSRSPGARGGVRIAHDIPYPPMKLSG